MDDISAAEAAARAQIEQLKDDRDFKMMVSIVSWAAHYAVEAAALTFHDMDLSDIPSELRQDYISHKLFKYADDFIDNGLPGNTPELLALKIMYQTQQSEAAQDEIERILDGEEPS